MLEVNRITINDFRKSKDIAKHIQMIFQEHWTEAFLFDSITGREFTYSSFFSAVLNCKKELEKQGLKAGDRVCLILSNSADLVVLYFTSLISNIIVVPIDPKKGSDEVELILSQLKYNLILSDDEGKLKIKVPSIRLADISQSFYKGIDGLDEKENLKVFSDCDYEKLFMISFTSGSTGVPKGVMHSFKNLALTAIAFKERMGFSSKNTFYHILPMTYMAGILNTLILPFLSESKIVLGERFNVANAMRFWNTPIKYKVNTFFFVPTIINMLMTVDRGTEGKEYAKNNDLIGCSATAPLSPKLKSDFEKKYGFKVFESYGLSETLFLTANSPSEDNAGLVGRPLEGVKLSFSDDHEIIIDVPWMFFGYVNFQSQFKIGSKFDSGDLGEFQDGILKITGRKKDIIVRGGINISPKLIENTLEHLGYFEEFTVMGVTSQNEEKTACFFVPPTKFTPASKEVINKSLSEKLGANYKIDIFFQLDQMPKNTNGKIDKIRLAEVYKQNDN